eukprot:scaffold4675_cov127-Amphora_coffeaeformis.AAC.5
MTSDECASSPIRYTLDLGKENFELMHLLLSPVGLSLVGGWVNDPTISYAEAAADSVLQELSMSVRGIPLLTKAILVRQMRVMPNAVGETILLWYSSNSINSFVVSLWSDLLTTTKLRQKSALSIISSLLNLDGANNHFPRNSHQQLMMM